MGTRRRQPPDLMVEMRRVLGADHPLPLLTLVSSLLAAVDPRASNPLGPPVAPRDDLRRTLVEVDQPETTAVLKAMAALTPDDLERRRIRQVVDARRHPLPVWMGEISRVEAYRATELAHALGDCDSLSVGARFPSGEELTVVAYIDHNLGTVLRDAFVVPEPIATVLALFQSKDDNPDTTMAELGPASARARLTEAIDRGASLFPPLVTDTWPGCRLLVEWVARLLPAGGSGYPRREWSDGDRHALAARFFASPHSAGLDHPDFGLLLERVLWFACDDGAGDPMRWSPATVEVVLTDWFPRKVMGATRFLHKLPRLLRAFIRFCHAERSLRPELTAETLGAVDRWEPDYRKGVRTPRPVDAAAWLAAIGAFAGDDELDDDLDYFDGYDDGPGPVDHQAILRDTLAGEVGGPAALAALAADPLPDEPFSWESIPSDVHGEVARVLAGCDRCCDELLDVEYRTACRRLLARAAAGDPGAFRRGARVDNSSAGILWAVGTANSLFSPSLGVLRVKDIAAFFGVNQGGINQRGRTLVRAAGIDHYSGLGSPDYLAAAARRRLIERRDRLDHLRRSF